MVVNFILKPYYESSVFKYYLHLAGLLGMAAGLVFVFGLYLKKYEGENQKINEKNDDIESKLKGIFDRIRNDGASKRSMLRAKLALITERSKGSFKTIKTDEDIEEVEKFVNRIIEEDKKAMKEEKKKIPVLPVFSKWNKIKKKNMRKKIAEIRDELNEQSDQSDEDILDADSDWSFSSGGLTSSEDISSDYSL